MAFRAHGGPQTPGIDDFRPAQNSCIKNPGVKAPTETHNKRDPPITTNFVRDSGFVSLISYKIQLKQLKCPGPPGREIVSWVVAVVFLANQRQKPGPLTRLVFIGDPFSWGSFKRILTVFLWYSTGIFSVFLKYFNIILNLCWRYVTGIFSVF